jgi:hypothetical protein
MSSRENANDTNQVVIVDLSDANNVIRRPSKPPPLFDVWNELMIVTADSAIMHPKEKIIALKCTSLSLKKEGIIGRRADKQRDDSYNCSTSERSKRTISHSGPG